LKACRYDGEMIDAPWLRRLASNAEIVDVCPEVEIGLGVPRRPINLIKNKDGVRITQEETNLDLSEELVSFSEGYLRFVGKIDAFILKSKSPSCGIGTSKIRQSNGNIRLGSGVFASQALRFFPGAIFVDEHFMEDNSIDVLLDLINQC
jgi:uncharacterized protein YbbK (DUF523 family)